MFTAADRNQDGVRGLVLLEPQYVNKYLDNEDHNLTLGRKVLPRLLDRSVPVFICGRYVERPHKYLPDGRADRIHTLPKRSQYHVLAYPLPKTGTVASLHPLVAHRYSRLLHGSRDAAVDEILGSTDPTTFDQETVDAELRIDAWIDRRRKSGATDEHLVRTVFSPEYEPDMGGAFYPHSLVLTGGQSFDTSTNTYRTFINEALLALS